MRKFRLDVKRKLFLGFVVFYITSGLIPGYLVYLIGLLDLDVNTGNDIVLLVSLPVFGLLCLIVGLYLRKWLTNPMRKVSKAAEDLANGIIDVDLNIHTDDEIESLAESLSRMKASLKIAFDWLGPFTVDNKAGRQKIKGLTITERVVIGLVAFLIIQPVLSLVIYNYSDGSLIAPSYITFVLSMVLLIIIVSYLDTVINKPLVRLAEAAERVSKGDFETEIEVTQPGDIGMLELNFKLISERVQRAMKELDMDD